MAKRPKQNEKTNGDLNILDLGASIGLNLMTDDSLSHVDDIIPTMMPSLDYILGGGIPLGRVTELYGLNQSGKSVLAVHLTKMAKLFDTTVIWIDVEGTSSPDNLAQLGVDPSGIFVVAPEDGEVLTIEYVTQKVKMICDTFGKADVPVLVIWDSLASTAAEQQLKDGFNLNQMGKLTCPLYK